MTKSNLKSHVVLVYCYVLSCLKDSKANNLTAPRAERRNCSELKRTELTRFSFFCELTNGRAGRAYALVDAYTCP